MSEVKFCKKCGAAFGDGDVFCGKCGWSVSENASSEQAQQYPQPYQQEQYQQQTYQQQPYQQAPPGGYVYVTQTVQQTSNGCGTAGFVFALLGLLLSWVPVLGWILWILGAILSLVGVFRFPKGLAIAGLIISFIGVIVLIIILAIAGFILF